MPETAAFRGWKAQDAIEWFHGIGRLVHEHFKLEALAGVSRGSSGTYGRRMLRIPAG
jgi:hypothetical protein